MIKLKSSLVLNAALDNILNGSQSFVCAAIQDVETTVRLDKKDEVKSNALKYFSKYRPKHVREDLKTFGEWWPKTDKQSRIAALRAAIDEAVANND